MKSKLARIGPSSSGQSLFSLYTWKPLATSNRTIISMISPDLAVVFEKVATNLGLGKPAAKICATAVIVRSVNRKRFNMVCTKFGIYRRKFTR